MPDEIVKGKSLSDFINAEQPFSDFGGIQTSTPAVINQKPIKVNTQPRFKPAPATSMFAVPPKDMGNQLALDQGMIDLGTTLRSVNQTSTPQVTESLGFGAETFGRALFAGGQAVQDFALNTVPKAALTIVEAAIENSQPFRFQIGDIAAIEPLSPEFAGFLDTTKTKAVDHINEVQSFLDQERFKNLEKLGITADTPITDPARFTYSVTSGLLSVATAVAITMATKNPTLAATVLGGLEGTDTYNQAREKGKSPQTSLNLAAVNTAGIILLERLGLEFMFKSYGGGKLYGASVKAVLETIQEESQTLWSSLVEKFGIDPELSSKDILSRMVDTFIVTLPVGFISGGAVEFTATEQTKQDLKDNFGIEEIVSEEIIEKIKTGVNKAKDDFSEVIERASNDQRGFIKVPGITEEGEVSPELEPIVKEARSFETAEEFAELISPESAQTLQEANIQPQEFFDQSQEIVKRRTEGVIEDFDLTPEEATTKFRELFKEDEVKFMVTDEIFEQGATRITEGVAGRFSQRQRLFSNEWLSMVEVVESNGKVSSKTLYHEAYHAFFNNYLDSGQRNEIIAKVKANPGAISQVLYPRENYATAEERAEEWMADDFAKFMESQETGKPYRGFLREQWEKLLNVIRRGIRQATGLQTVYDKILTRDRTQRFVKVPITRNKKGNKRNFLLPRTEQQQDTFKVSSKWITDWVLGFETAKPSTETIAYLSQFKSNMDYNLFRGVKLDKEVRDLESWSTSVRTAKEHSIESGIEDAKIIEETIPNNKVLVDFDILLENTDVYEAILETIKDKEGKELFDNFIKSEGEVIVSKTVLPNNIEGTASLPEKVQLPAEVKIPQTVEEFNALSLDQQEKVYSKLKPELIEEISGVKPDPESEKVVGRTEEYNGLEASLKERVKTFFRPSRKQNARAFSLLGNKDTTVPLFMNVFNKWVETGTEIIVEPYAGAFTLGTHSISQSIKSGLKEFHSNIFDREKFIIVKSIQDGNIQNIEKFVNDAVQKLSDSIREHASTNEVKSLLDEFFKEYPNSFIGSAEFHSFVTERPIGSQVTVYEDDRKAWAKTFQGAYNELFTTEFDGGLEEAVLNEVIKRTGMFGGKGQSLIGINGFRPFAARLFGNFGMVEAFKNMDTVFKLAKEKDTNIFLYNEDGAGLIQKLDVDPVKTAYYLDPPYTQSADVYENAKELANFASGQALVDSHSKAFENVQNGAKMALTNDVDQEYMESLEKATRDAKLFAYKEGATPTSLIVTGETEQFISDFLVEGGKLTGGEREEVARIKELQRDKELSNLTVSRIKKDLAIKNIRTASDEQLDDLISFMETLETGDKFITPLQIESLADLIDVNLFNKKVEFITQRELIDTYGELTEINEGRITKFIADDLFPSVDIKEKNPLVKRTVDKTSKLLDESEKRTEKRAEELHGLFKVAEKERRAKTKGLAKVKRLLIPQHEEVFRALSGEEVDLTPGEVTLVKYLQDFFEQARNDMKLENIRENYITHMEASWSEKIIQQGVIQGFISIVTAKRKKTLEQQIPVNIMIELDNIIGSDKFFKFALRREGGITPSFNLRRVVNEYSRMFEEKMALDHILPEGQAITQLLLQPRTAMWQKRFLQNLKGRGLDFKFRNGKFGWLAKFTDNMIGIGYIKLLGLNHWSGVKNWVAGTANSFITQDTFKFFTGKQRFISNPRKTIRIATENHIMEGAFYEYISEGFLEKFKRTKDWAFIYQRAGEWEIRGSMMAGELTEEEWNSGKISTERIREIKDLIAITQGVFTKVDSPLWVQTWYGRMFMQMNRWRVTNINLIRRIGPAAVKEVRAGNYTGKNAQRLLKALVLYGIGMWLAWELRKAGYKQSAKIAQSMAEGFNSIVELFTTPVILDMFTQNPTLSFMGEMFFSMQELSALLKIPGVEAPRSIDFNKGIEDTFISPIQRTKELVELGIGAGESDLDLELDLDLDLELDLDLDLDLKI